MRPVHKNAECPCGSGFRYVHCCRENDFAYVEHDDGAIHRQMPMTHEMLKLVCMVRDARDAGALQPIVEWFKYETAKAMQEAEIHPALVHAFIESGLMLHEDSDRKCPTACIAEWEGLIDQWEAANGQKAPRRLAAGDLSRILANGPK